MRLLASAIVIACITISAIYRVRARRSSGTIARSSEPHALIAARLLMALPLVAVLGTTLAIPRLVAFAELPLPVWARALGGLLGGLAVPLMWWVFHSIGSNISETVLTKEHHQLVTHGPYRWVRHPLYSAATLLLLAVGLMTASALLLAFAGLVPILVLIAVIPREERALEEKFGARYSEYRSRTGALLPHFPRPDHQR